MGTDNDLVVMSHGVLGGKQVVTKTRSTPTNVGRSNERNGVQQAEFEAKSAWTSKRDEGYFEVISEAESSIVYLPMLAYPIVKKIRDKSGKQIEKRRKFSYPVDVQRKLNGLRCLASHKQLLSRQGTVWNIPHIHEQVKQMIDPREMLDGEVYCHGLPLQQHNSLIKDNRPESAALEYHVYDFPINVAGAKTWLERKDVLMHAFTVYQQRCADLKIQPVIKLVETLQCVKEEQVKALEKIVLQEGYEGLILRKLDGLYYWNDRKDCLLKWKFFQDCEFDVVDMLSRDLIDPDTHAVTSICDVCICKNNTSEKTFKVVPIGSMKQRAEYWTNRESLIGQRLVVRFLERSVDGIPQGNPVGVAFRLPEDGGDEADMWENK